MNQPGWSYSAERAWYEPPEYDTPTPPENDISVKQLIKIMNERNSNAMKLYEISADYAKFIEDFDNGDIPEEAFADTLDALDGTFKDACVAFALSIENDNATIAALDTEIERLNARKKKLTTSIEGKKSKMLEYMQRVGVDKITDDPRVHIAVRTNSTPRTVFSDRAAFLYQAVAEGWTKYLTKPKPDLNIEAVKEDLKNGAKLPGVYLEYGKRVDIS